jgi:hypothetical protein
VSADPPDLPGPADPSVDCLVRALTADGYADELADRQAALAMFRDSRRRPRRRFSFPMSTAAAAVVVAAGLASAYAALLPPPVQHLAYRFLDGIGVPDAHHPSPRPNAATIPSTVSPSTASPSTASKSAVSASPVRTGSGLTRTPTPNPTQDVIPAQDLVLASAYTRIAADGDDVLSGRLAAGGRAEPGVRVRLLEHVDGVPGWRYAGRAVTDRRGDVTFTVQDLTSDASFRLTGPKGATSLPVVVTVVPPVSLELAVGQKRGTDVLTAVAPFADPGDPVVLQELSGKVWRRVGEHLLDEGHQASFTVRIPKSGGLEYRVVLPRTLRHGRSRSSLVRVAPARPEPTPQPTVPRVTTTARPTPT